ncbi:MAG: hypothetical protein HUU29_08545, partial [Planctomycetaceae bacterium]|nr:hypothetical protein [Planctomycetaceae bacterium]
MAIRGKFAFALASAAFLAFSSVSVMAQDATPTAEKDRYAGLEENQRKIAERLDELLRTMAQAADDLDKSGDAKDAEDARRLREAVKKISETDVSKFIRAAEKALAEMNIEEAVTKANGARNLMFEVLKILDGESEFIADDRIAQLEAAIRDIEDIRQQQDDLRKDTENQAKTGANQAISEMRNEAERLQKTQEELRDQTQAAMERAANIEQLQSRLDDIRARQEEVERESQNLAERMKEAEAQNLRDLQAAKDAIDKMAGQAELEKMRNDN